MYLEEHGLPAVSAHNVVLVHVSTPKGDIPKPMFCEYGQAHKRRQAPIQGYGLQYRA